MGIEIAESLTGSHLENPIYKEEGFRKKLINLRNDGNTWDEVSNKLKAEYSVPIVSETVKKIYNEVIATTITLDKKAGADYSAYREQLRDLYGKSVESLELLMKALNKVLMNFKEADDIDQLLAAQKILKLMPQIKALISEVREFNKFQKEQEDKLQIQQESIYYSPEQINAQVEKVLHVLEKEGKIKILKDLGFN